MLRKIIKTSLLIPISILVTVHQSILSENKNYIDAIIEEKEDKIFINHKEIKNIILNNNDELKSLKKLIEAQDIIFQVKLLKGISIDYKRMDYPNM